MGSTELFSTKLQGLPSVTLRVVESEPSLKLNGTPGHAASLAEIADNVIRSADAILIIIEHFLRLNDAVIRNKFYRRS